MRLRHTWFQHPWTFINVSIQFTIDPNSFLSARANFLCCAQQQETTFTSSKLKTSTLENLHSAALLVSPRGRLDIRHTALNKRRMMTSFMALQDGRTDGQVNQSQVTMNPKRAQRGRRGGSCGSSHTDLPV